MRYKYQAIDAQNQTVSGILTADSDRDAARQLRKRNLNLVSLTLDEKKQTTVKGKAKQRDMLMVLHELTTLLSSGVSLIEAVESISHSSHHPQLTQAFTGMASQLRQGKNFAQALKDSPLTLPWYVHQLVEAGELTGKVAEGLRDGLAQLEYDTRMKAEIQGAMIYPTILILSGISAVLLIFIFVVPQFANLLKNRAADVPLLASIVLNTGMFLKANLQWISLGAIAIVAFIATIVTQPQVRLQLWDKLAKLPLIGTWLVESETARWSAMMATLLQNRVPLLKALELAEQGVQLLTLRSRLSQVSKAVRAGVNLSQALHDNDALTSTGHNLIRAGERAGELPRMLRSLANLLEESGKVRMKQALALIEPISILVIGGIIGLIVTGVILAITSLQSVAV